ncbi:unnamed protein product [Effrenium voratum]|nr:unnamed protein product [Effrenium voratum]
MRRGNKRWSEGHGWRGFNEDRFIYVQALLIGRTVRVRTSNMACFEGRFHSCSQDPDCSIVIENAREMVDGQPSGEAIEKLIIPGEDVKLLEATEVPPSEQFGPESEKLKVAESMLSEYNEDHMTQLDPSCIPVRDREKAERLARQIEAGNDRPAQDSQGQLTEERLAREIDAGDRPAQDSQGPLAEVPDLQKDGSSSSSRLGRTNDLARIKRKEGMLKEPTAGRGLNAMNLELPMHAGRLPPGQSSGFGRMPPDPKANLEIQVAQQALHQLKELQNVQGTAATRQILLRQHFRLDEVPDANSDDGRRPNAAKGRPLDMIQPLQGSQRRGREEEVMVGPVPVGVVTGVANERDPFKSINSLNLEPGPPKLLHKLLEGRIEPPPIERPQNQPVQESGTFASPFEGAATGSGTGMEAIHEGMWDGHMQPTEAELRQYALQAPPQMDRRKTGEGKASQPQQPLQPGQQPTRPQPQALQLDRIDDKRRASKDALLLSLSEELPQPLAVGRQGRGKGQQSSESKSGHALSRTGTPSSLSDVWGDPRGEPCGLPLQMLPTRTMETMGSTDLPVDHEQGHGYPFEPGLMKRQFMEAGKEGTPPFQCNTPGGSPLTTGIVISRFFEAASKEPPPSAATQWPQATGQTYRNILAESQLAANTVPGMVNQMPMTPQASAQQGAGDEVQAGSHMMAMRSAGPEDKVHMLPNQRMQAAGNPAMFQQLNSMMQMPGLGSALPPPQEDELQASATSGAARMRRPLPARPAEQEAPGRAPALPAEAAAAAWAWPVAASPCVEAVACVAAAAAECVAAGRFPRAAAVACVLRRVPATQRYPGRKATPAEDVVDVERVQVVAGAVPAAEAAAAVAAAALVAVVAAEETVAAAETVAAVDVADRAVDAAIVVAAAAAAMPAVVATLAAVATSAAVAMLVVAAMLAAAVAVAAAAAAAAVVAEATAEAAATVGATVAVSHPAVRGASPAAAMWAAVAGARVAVAARPAAVWIISEAVGTAAEAAGTVADAASPCVAAAAATSPAATRAAGAPGAPGAAAAVHAAAAAGPAPAPVRRELAMRVERRPTPATRRTQGAGAAAISMARCHWWA